MRNTSGPSSRSGRSSRSGTSSGQRSSSKRRKAETTASSCKTVLHEDAIQVGQIFNLDVSNVDTMHKLAYPTMFLPDKYSGFTLATDNVKEFCKDLNKDFVDQDPSTEERLMRFIRSIFTFVANEYNLHSKSKYLLTWEDSQNKFHSAIPDFMIYKSPIEDNVLAVVAEAKSQLGLEANCAQLIYQMAVVFSKRQCSAPVVGILTNGFDYYFLIVDIDRRVYCSGTPVHLAPGNHEGTLDYRAEGSTAHVLYSWLRMAIDVLLATTPPGTPDAAGFAQPNAAGLAQPNAAGLAQPNAAGLAPPAVDVISMLRERLRSIRPEEVRRPADPLPREQS